MNNRIAVHLILTLLYVWVVSWFIGNVLPINGGNWYDAPMFATIICGFFALAASALKDQK